MTGEARRIDDEDVETVDHAAVKKDGRVYVVERPLRHDAAIRKAVEELWLPILGEHEQGFVTSEGRFVDRWQAARIAVRARQINSLSDLRGSVLTSEDLW